MKVQTHFFLFLIVELANFFEKKNLVNEFATREIFNEKFIFILHLIIVITITIMYEEYFKKQNARYTEL